MATSSSSVSSQIQPVIVVGSGLAGLSAATQLVSHHIPVNMLESAIKPGGHAIKATSGINGAPTRFQPVKDDREFFNDTVKSAGSVLIHAAANDRSQRERLISTLTESSAAAVHWLADEKDIDLSKVTQLGGHTHPRTHRGAGQSAPPGKSIVSTLLNSLNGNSFFQLRTSSRVTKVVREGDRVTGVEYTREEEDNNKSDMLHGPVVFASGGFAGDTHGMLAKYRPDLAGLPTTNEPRKGSHPLLEEIGAALVDMDRVQVHPTGFLDPNDRSAVVKLLAPEALRGEGGVLLSRDGSRFVNELDTREHIANVIMHSVCPMETTTLRQWDVTLVLDEGAAASASSHMQFYLSKGLIRKTIVGELGPSALRTLQAYADAVSGRKQDTFGRTSFGRWALMDVAPDSIVYAGKVTPVVHFTMGGVRINERSEVLDGRGVPIKGLWATGEVSGGVHGQNRLSGSSLLECVVFGRIAGDEAAAFHKKYYTHSP
ncbi:uncharacterized protein CDV56_101568 [Aspergillus thermomutatus]|uniref:Fumarate reductase n=1 Tax=Aspergillus thermomutatus TaxID=41047 RepID=A0A397G0B4_ASPTH|nr:uncharacterized protein CDV56_101568 [Aspergillus thermomutatus]RHZ44482.1 hypothetical protein CDV56_101568 [Aspergillus thermomutatus]